MADFDNATAFAHYADFSVGRDSVNPDEDGYPLTVDQYSGTAGTDCQRIVFFRIFKHFYIFTETKPIQVLTICHEPDQGQLPSCLFNASDPPVLLLLLPLLHNVTITNRNTSIN